MRKITLNEDEFFIKGMSNDELFIIDATEVQYFDNYYEAKVACTQANRLVVAGLSTLVGLTDVCIFKYNGREGILQARASVLIPHIDFEDWIESEEAQEYLIAVAENGTDREADFENVYDRIILGGK